MPCDAAGLGIVYLYRGLRPKLVFLDIEKTGFWLVGLNLLNCAVTYFT